MFEGTDIRKMLATAGPTIKAIILLGVNCGFDCGFGARDVGTLPKSAVNLQGGWIQEKSKKIDRAENRKKTEKLERDFGP